MKENHIFFFQFHMPLQFGSCFFSSRNLHNRTKYPNIFKTIPQTFQTFRLAHPPLERWSNWRDEPKYRRHTFLESLGHGKRKSGKKAGLRAYSFFLEAERSSAEARTLEFWNAVLCVSWALPKMKNSCYGLFWFSNEKSAKAMIFCFRRPVGSLSRPIKVAKKYACHWNF